MNDIDTIRRILGAARVAVITTRSDDNHLYSRPMGILDEEFDGTLWFFTQDPSPKTQELRYEPEVNVSVADSKGYLSLSGVATVVHDRARIDKLWNPFVEAWFENGKDSPDVALLRVAVSTAEYWSVDKPAPVRLLEIAKGILTHSQPKVGESHTVQLADTD